jgi:riboflavin kinase / FMN adenylyltransferase
LTDYSKYFLQPDDLPSERGKVISIGAFDGCHLGHQKLLEQVDYAVTFLPTPKVFFSATGQVLMLPEEKRQRFDRFIFLKFDEKLVELSAREFMDLIIQTLAPRRIVVGWDFHFGKNLSGSVHTLEKLAEQYSFELEVVPPVKFGRLIVKSTTIRDLIAKGDIEKANAMLGYEFFYLAKVIHGKKLGRQLGFPTANLAIDRHKLLPDKGVYAGHVEVEGKKYKAAISVAHRPRIELEAFLLDFDGDIYGEAVKIVFSHYLREQREFSGLRLLENQIAKDVETVRTLLK